MNTKKSPTLYPKPVTDSPNPPVNENTIDLSKLGDKFSEEVMLPVFNVLGRIKVKKPVF